MVGRPHHPHYFVLTGHIWLENRYINSRHCVQLRLRTRARLSAQASVLAHDLQPALHLAQANLCQMACILARLQHVLQGLQCHALAAWKLQPIQHMFQSIQALLDAFGYSLQLAFLFCAARDRSDGVAGLFDCADQLVASCLCLSRGNGA